MDPGEIAFPNNNRWVSHAVFEGMSGQARLVLDLVQGWEVVVRPGSSYAQFANTSPPHDPRALEAYCAIRRHLKDAYPAAYNDWDKLWAVIKTIGRVVLPFIGMLGPVGAGVATVGSTAIGVVDQITKGRANAKAKSKALVKARTTMVSGPSTTTRSS